MSKQDRQGVRKPEDIERKYGLGEFMYKQNQSNQEFTRQLNNLGDSLSSYKSENDQKLSTMKEEVDTSISTVTKELSEDIDALSKQIFNMIYPVGAIYISVSATNPSTLFGGTWSQIKDTFLLAAGSNYTAGATGGEANHTLTVEEMPKHIHKLRQISWGGKGLNTEVDKNGCYFVYDQDEEYTPSGSYFESVGNSQPHNNMPPYLAVYVWKRTA